MVVEYILFIVCVLVYVYMYMWRWPTKSSLLVEHVYYINLKHRPDRDAQIRKEIQKLGLLDKTTRIEGVYEKGRGHLGCSQSHIMALEQFLQSPHQNCIIFEDDFQFRGDHPTPALNQVFEQGVEYDVIMLSAGWTTAEKSQYDFLKKSTCTTTASGYLVNRKFAPRLLENFREGVRLLEDAYNRGSKIDGTGDALYAIDQYWCRLQGVSNWYIMDPVLGEQSGSRSDIMV